MVASLQLASALRGDSNNTVGTCNDWVGFTANQFLRISSSATPRVYDTSCAVFTVTRVDNTNLMLVVVDVKGGGCSNAFPDTLSKSNIPHNACANTYTTPGGVPACPPPLLTSSSPLTVSIAGLRPCFACSLSLTLSQCAANPQCTPTTRVTNYGVSLYTGCASVASSSPAVNSCPMYLTSRPDPSSTGGAVLGIAIGCAVGGALIVALLGYFVVKGMKRKRGPGPAPFVSSSAPPTAAVRAVASCDVADGVSVWC